MSGDYTRRMRRGSPQRSDAGWRRGHPNRRRAGRRRHYGISPGVESVALAAFVPVASAGCAVSSPRTILTQFGTAHRRRSNYRHPSQKEPVQFQFDLRDRGTGPLPAPTRPQIRQFVVVPMTRAWVNHRPARRCRFSRRHIGRRQTATCLRQRPFPTIGIAVSRTSGAWMRGTPIPRLTGRLTLSRGMSEAFVGLHLGTTRTCTGPRRPSPGQSPRRPRPAREHVCQAPATRRSSE